MPADPHLELLLSVLVVTRPSFQPRRWYTLRAPPVLLVLAGAPALVICTGTGDDRRGGESTGSSWDAPAGDPWEQVTPGSR